MVNDFKWPKNIALLNKGHEGVICESEVTIIIHVNCPYLVVAFKLCFSMASKFNKDYCLQSYQ